MMRSEFAKLLLFPAVIILFVCLFTGCAPGQSDILAPEPFAGNKQLTEEVRLSDRLFIMELALTPEQRAQGLMGRTSLADNKGMLFVFPDIEPFPAEVTFWMKNCLMPIDVIFISRERQITAIHEMQPPLPGTPDRELLTYSSNGPVQFAIELRGGLAAELGLQIEDIIDLRGDYLLNLAR